MVSPTAPRPHRSPGLGVGVGSGRRSLAALVAAASLASAHALEPIDLWRGALAVDPAHAAARAARSMGDAQRRQAATLWNPTVELQAGLAHADSSSATRGARFSAPGFGQSDGVAFDTAIRGEAMRLALTVRQPLLDRERDARRQQLQLTSDAADLGWRQAQQDLVLHSAVRYFGLALAQADLQLVQRQLLAVERTLVEARDRFRIGDRPITDVHEASARAAELQARRVVADNELAVQRLALRDFSGLDAGSGALALPTATPALDALGKPDEWAGAAEVGNHAVRLAQVRLATAQEESRRLTGAFSPTLALVAQASQDRTAGGADFGSASQRAGQRSVGLQLVVPLSTGGSRAALQSEALAGETKARAELAAAQLRAARDARAGWLALTSGVARSAALQEAWQASQARLDATRVGHQAGDRTTLDLLQAETAAAAAEYAVLEARAQLLIRHLELAALAGRLDETLLARLGATLVPRR